MESRILIFKNFESSICKNCLKYFRILFTDFIFQALHTKQESFIWFGSLLAQPAQILLGFSLVRYLLS